MKKRTLFIALAVVITAAITLLALRPRGAQPSNPESIQTGTVTSISKADIVETTGEFEVHPYAELTWTTSGYVGDIQVKPGDLIKKDQVLMSLDRSSVSASILNAQAELITAQQTLDDLLHSDTARATAWIALQDAEDDLEDAENYRESLDDEQKYTVAKLVTMQTPMGLKKVPVMRTYKASADAETIRNADADLALAKARYGDALREYEKVKDGIDQDELAITQSRIDAAQATLDAMSITAPFAGEVLYVDASAGELVNSGTPAVIIADTDHYFVEALVDESDMAAIQIGQSALITSDSQPDVLFNGVVTAINPVGRNVNGLIKFTVQIALAPSSSTILLGSTANVEILVSEESTRLLVPLAAIKTGSEGEYVEVLRGDTLQQVVVESGDLDGENVVVSGDLHAGDQVVISYKTKITLPGFGTQE